MNEIVKEQNFKHIANALRAAGKTQHFMKVVSTIMKSKPDEVVKHTYNGHSKMSNNRKHR